jgi:hypothetical protein
MKTTKTLLSILLLTIISFSFTQDNCTVKYNGIYAFKLNEEYSAVLRFYEDGTVLASSSVNDYMDVFSWFHKENKNMVLTGKYKIKKCKITFDVSGNTGEQKYEGEINGDKIEFELIDKASNVLILFMLYNP